METLELTETIPNMDVVKLNVTDTEIAKMKADYMGLTINGIEDRAGLKQVYDARQVVKRTRVGLVKYSDELKEKALAWQRKVNAEKNRIVSELETIEDHLQSEEDKIAAEKKAIEEARAKVEYERVQSRIDRLAAFGYSIEYNTIKTIDDTSFEIVLENAKGAYEKELAEKAEAERLAKEEAEKLKAEREELERLRAEHAKAQAIIQAEQERVRKEQEEKEQAIRLEQQRIEAEKQAAERQRLQAIEDKRRADELEQAKKEAAEKARLKAIEDARIQAERKAEQERVAAAKAAKKLALAPDKDKLLLLAANISATVLPNLKSEEANAILNEVKTLLQKVSTHIHTRSEAL